MKKHLTKNNTSPTIKKSAADYFVEGYAMLWEPYKYFEMPKGEYYEAFDRKAFNKTDMSSIVLLKDHTGSALASVQDRTLSVKVDDRGLKVIADLFENRRKSKGLSKHTIGEIKQNVLVF